MQNLVKDFNYKYEPYTNKVDLYYLDDDFTIKLYRSYEVVGKKITDVYNTSVDIRILKDIQELVKLGFRYNPYLIDNIL